MSWNAAGLASAAGLTPFISTQADYHLLNRGIEAELVPACNAQGLSVLPYFPLASGFLTGKYPRGEPPPPAPASRCRPISPAASSPSKAYDRLERLEAFAVERRRSVLELAIGWLASQPHVGSIIAGASRPEQIDQNVAASDWRLDASELADVDAITKS